jgi:hypothetical protein
VDRCRPPLSACHDTLPSTSPPPPGLQTATPDDEDGDGRARPGAARGRRSAAARLLSRRVRGAGLLGRLLCDERMPQEQEEWLGARLVGLLADDAHPQVTGRVGATRAGRQLLPQTIARAATSALHLLVPCRRVCRVLWLDNGQVFSLGSVAPHRLVPSSQPPLPPSPPPRCRRWCAWCAATCASSAPCLCRTSTCPPSRRPGSRRAAAGARARERERREQQLGARAILPQWRRSQKRGCGGRPRRGLLRRTQRSRCQASLQPASTTPPCSLFKAAPIPQVPPSYPPPPPHTPTPNPKGRGVV